MAIDYFQVVERLLPSLKHAASTASSTREHAVARSVVEALMLTAEPTLTPSGVVSETRLEAVLRIVLEDRFPSSEPQKDAVASVAKRFSEADRSRLRASVARIRSESIPLMRGISADFKAARLDDVDPSLRDGNWADERYGCFWGCLFSIGVCVVGGAGSQLVLGTLQAPDQIGSAAFWGAVVFVAFFVGVFAGGCLIYHHSKETQRRSRAKQSGQRATGFYALYRERCRVNGASL